MTFVRAFIFKAAFIFVLARRFHIRRMHTCTRFYNCKLLIRDGRGVGGWLLFRRCTRISIFITRCWLAVKGCFLFVCEGRNNRPNDLTLYRPGCIYCTLIRPQLDAVNAHSFASSPHQLTHRKYGSSKNHSESDFFQFKTNLILNNMSI